MTIEPNTNNTSSFDTVRFLNHVSQYLKSGNDIQVSRILIPAEELSRLINLLENTSWYQDQYNDGVLKSKS